MMRNKRHGGIRGVEILLALAVIGLLTLAASMQHGRLSKLEFKQELFRQRVKLPPAEIMRFVTVGYDNIYADWLWLQSIQAFGSGWITDDGTTKPIYQYFDTMTDMDPTFIPSYRFGNLIIGDNRLDYEGGKNLLIKGTLKNPMNYDVPYLGIYNAMFQSDDYEGARWFAYRLRRIPNTPGFISRMEEYIERQNGRFEAAYEMNVRYYLRYLVLNNDIEREIIERRMIDVVDRQARKVLEDACWAYAEAHEGRHPERMEDLLEGDWIKPYRAPRLTDFTNALSDHADDIEKLSASEEIPEPLVRSIVEASTHEFRGLPPEPNGTWFMIWGPSREYFQHVQWSPDMPRGDIPYIRSARELIQEFNFLAMKAQSAIMTYVDGHDGKRPTEAEIKEYLGRDALGGHYVYQPEAPESPRYGVFFSTAMRRIDEGKEPRLGLQGPGPFPFPIMPRLADHPEDAKWALEKGYLQPDGTELYYLESEAPNWEKLRAAHLKGDKPSDQDEPGIEGPPEPPKSDKQTPGE